MPDFAGTGSGNLETNPERGSHITEVRGKMCVNHNTISLS